MADTKKTKHELELERMAECTRLGVPYKRKRGRPPGAVKKLKLTPEVPTREHRSRRKRRTPLRDKNSPQAIKMRQTHGPGSEWYKLMEERVWGPRRRGEIPSGREGIPDGYTRESAQVMFAEAEKKAEIVLAKLKENGHFRPEELPEDDAGRAELALKECLRIGLADVNSAVRISALGQVLKYCRVAPEKKSKVTIESAEDWLAAAIADSTDDAEDADEAAQALPH